MSTAVPHRRPAMIAVWALVGSIVMLFFGLVSALVGRRGGPDWGPIEPSPVLWASTSVILLSSAAMEVARRALAGRRLGAFLTALGTTAALGLAFLGGQLLAWRALRDAGVYLASSPHSSYFYLITGVHGAHLAGGLIALGVVLRRAMRAQYAPDDRGDVDALAVYWHFLGVLWILLFAVLFAL
jgi:cytochrome c oxidase subunit 3